MDISNRPSWVKMLYVGIGIFSLAIGAIGIVVPLLPGFPFLLLSVVLFSKSSKKLHDWMMHHAIFGKSIRDFFDKKPIPLRTKITAIAFACVSTIISVLIVVNRI